MSVDIKKYLEEKQQLVDGYLEANLPPIGTPPTVLHESIRYSLLAGGKRIRPILTVAAAESIGPPPKALLPVACAFEFIHTYSLIHDDLPAMDNDDFRRGKPTNHKVYGDGMAILAGDGLQTMAFEWCSRVDLVNDIEPYVQVQIIAELAHGSGNQGMVGGQVLDIQAENTKVDFAEIQNIHAHKTGKLIRAAVRAGALLSGANLTQFDQLTAYAEDIGLAFQIADDVLNVTGTREELGKDANTDAERGKQTYPSFYGLKGAKKLAQECADRAISRLSSFDEKADPLRGIAQYIVSRRN
ncbi:farnesyl diphosphate synthase [Candidatus Nitronereus thalassa]|uniref:Polyprenyl synthetase family protein n=1 Tax=Candidatus Nitronereus thalassa TaxID=3020898 RepID=A0ABU3KA51_9BACT|nr:farnesyl diphosphate synthase [Candidatus Nitronereus thalassa]MDT7043276.1 polyprenyl synthetase family protein [Candidatus Nitronereus thalassa]